MNEAFWNKRNVFITGHTGFKGGWLSLWLTKMGANVYGYSLRPKNNSKSFFRIIKLEKAIKKSTFGNILNYTQLKKEINIAKPSIIIHLAAQPLVRNSYIDPIETYNVNVLGTVNILDIARKSKTVKGIINVTSDKCYEIKKNNFFYKENSLLGGHDPYSSSKSCSEILTSSFRDSFFKDKKICVATVRSGNVIGGGDWSVDRLVPDFFKAIYSKKNFIIRNPKAIRPWQHVLEPLHGYILLSEKLLGQKNKQFYSSAWNFGPDKNSFETVNFVTKYLSKSFIYKKIKVKKSKSFKETLVLKINSEKARKYLLWKSRWSLTQALDNTIRWYESYIDKKDMLNFSLEQIEIYTKNKF